MTCNKCNGSGEWSVTQWPNRKYRCDTCLGTGTRIDGRFYAGIGSRDTPDAVIAQMTFLASLLAAKGWVLRSGGAKPRVPKVLGVDSADMAFERGCSLVEGLKVIRISALSSGPAADHASQFHPNWSACSDYAKSKHARNSLIMLGDTLDQPVNFVVCWTKGGAITGGTGQALRIATALGTPVFNLAIPENYNILIDWIGRL